MKYAIVENNKVINVVIADEEYANQQGWIVCPNAIEIDWLYENGQFVEPPIQPKTTIQIMSPTKEELFAQLQTLQNQIQALE